MKERIEIEKVENGYAVTTWYPEQEEEGELSEMYPEPKRYVAMKKDEVMDLLKKHLK